MKIKGAYLILFGLLVWFYETSYFGRNAMPQSLAELVFDVVSAGITLSGFYFLSDSKSKTDSTK